MDLNDIHLLIRYNRWANANMMHAASALTVEQLTKNLGNSYGSVRDTLVHIMWAEWIWLRRWKGESPKTRFDPSEFKTLDEIRKRWSEIEAERVEYAGSLNEDSLSRVISYVNSQGETWKYPLSHMIQHIVNHSSYHRGQVITMLRQIGAQVQPTDFLVFIDIASAS